MNTIPFNGWILICFLPCREGLKMEEPALPRSKACAEGPAAPCHRYNGNDIIPGSSTGRH